MNGPDVGRGVARAVDTFLKTGDFRAVERHVMEDSVDAGRVG